MIGDTSVANLLESIVFLIHEYYQGVSRKTQNEYGCKKEDKKKNNK